ncbi:MAG: cell envelope integrity protein TolA, partial [Methylococcales bacterium]|nr:cell envelope integrity protein TolA [Methylococcales bacterium]
AEAEKAEAAAKAKAEAAAKAKAEAAAKAEAEKAQAAKIAAEQAEAARLKAEAEKAAKVAAEKAEAAKAKAVQNKQAIDEATAAIKQKVNRSWIRPADATGISCIIRVKLMSDGTVVDAQVVTSSGDEIFDRSAENAVNKASPLPVPSDKELSKEFRSFTFEFKPKN